MTYAIVFKPDEEPEIWEHLSGWPGTSNMHPPTHTHVYFYKSNSWMKWEDTGKKWSVPENEVPPEYRAIVLLFS